MSSPSSQGSPPEADHRLVHKLSIGFALLWAAASLTWLQLDRLPRDGDEEGHVGAAELFRLMLAEGRWGRALLDGLWGSYGEYPPLYAAWTGLGWWLSGEYQPGLGLEAWNLLWLPLAALCLGAAAARHSPASGALAFGGALLLPLSNGLARHYMPEGAITAALALCLWLGLRAEERPGWGRALALGLGLGLGLLLKQTFAIYAMGLALPALWRSRGWGLLSGLIAVALALPWLLGQSEAQADYLGRSAEGSGAALLDQVRLYPEVALWSGLGPPMALALALSLRQAWSDRVGRRALVGLGLGLLLLLAIPKKYPRLLAPLCPLAAVVVAVGLPPERRLGLGLASAGYLALCSLQPLPEPAVVGRVDPRCPQGWLGPPVGDDLGLDAVAQAVRGLPAGPVAVIAGPEIPCELQTTFPWQDHLSPYLRREGLEREVIGGPSAEAALTVDWSSGPGREVPVPALGRSFYLRPRPGLW